MICIYPLGRKHCPALAFSSKVKREDCELCIWRADNTPSQKPWKKQKEQLPLDFRNLLPVQEVKIKT